MADNPKITPDVEGNFDKFIETWVRVTTEMQKKGIKLPVEIDTKSLEDTLKGIVSSIGTASKEMTGFGERTNRTMSQIKKENKETWDAGTQAVEELEKKIGDLSNVKADLGKMLKIEGAEERLAQFIASGERDFQKFAESSKKYAEEIKDSIGSQAADSFVKGAGKFSQAGAEFMQKAVETQDAAIKKGKLNFQQQDSDIRRAILDLGSEISNLPEIADALNVTGMGDELVHAYDRALKTAETQTEALLKTIDAGIMIAENTSGGARAAGQLKRARGAATGEDQSEESKKLLSSLGVILGKTAQIRKGIEPTQSSGSISTSIGNFFSALDQGSAKASTVLLGGFSSFKGVIVSMAGDVEKTSAAFSQFQKGLISEDKYKQTRMQSIADIIAKIAAKGMEMDEEGKARVRSIRSLDMGSGAFLSNIADVAAGGGDMATAMDYVTDSEKTLAQATSKAARGVNMNSEEFGAFTQTLQKYGIKSQESGELIGRNAVGQIEKYAAMGQAMGLTQEATAGVVSRFSAMQAKGGNLQKSMDILAGSARFAGVDANIFAQQIQSVTENLEGLGVNVDEVTKSQSEGIKFFTDLKFSANGAIKYLNKLQGSTKDATAQQTLMAEQFLKKSPQWSQIQDNIAADLGKTKDQLSEMDIGVGLTEYLNSEIPKMIDLGGGQKVPIQSLIIHNIIENLKNQAGPGHEKEIEGMMFRNAGEYANALHISRDELYRQLKAEYHGKSWFPDPKDMEKGGKPGEPPKKPLTLDETIEKVGSTLDQIVEPASRVGEAFRLANEKLMDLQKKAGDQLALMGQLGLSEDKLNFAEVITGFQDSLINLIAWINEKTHGALSTAVGIAAPILSVVGNAAASYMGVKGAMAAAAVPAAETAVAGTAVTAGEAALAGTAATGATVASEAAVAGTAATAGTAASGLTAGTLAAPLLAIGSVAVAAYGTYKSFKALDEANQELKTGEQKENKEIHQTSAKRAAVAYMKGTDIEKSSTSGSLIRKEYEKLVARYGKSNSENIKRATEALTLQSQGKFSEAEEAAKKITASTEKKTTETPQTIASLTESTSKAMLDLAAALTAAKIPDLTTALVSTKNINIDKSAKQNEPKTSANTQKIIDNILGKNNLKSIASHSSVIGAATENGLPNILKMFLSHGLAGAASVSALPFLGKTVQPKEIEKMFGGLENALPSLKSRVEPGGSETTLGQVGKILNKYNSPFRETASDEGDDYKQYSLARRDMLSNNNDNIGYNAFDTVRQKSIENMAGTIGGTPTRDFAEIAQNTGRPQMNFEINPNISVKTEGTDPNVLTKAVIDQLVPYLRDMFRDLNRLTQNTNNSKATTSS